jgi:hypothetical protein
MSSKEEKLAAINAEKEKAIKEMMQSDPVAVDLLEGLQLLRIEIGAGGDFRFWAKKTANGVLIETTLHTGANGEPLKIMVQSDGKYICVSQGLASTHITNDSPDKNVIDALQIVTNEATQQGQLPFQAAASPEPRRELSPLAARLVEELDAMKERTGGQFDYTSPEVDGIGNVWLTAVFNTASGQSRVDIGVDQAQKYIGLDNDDMVGLKPINGSLSPSKDTIVKAAAALLEQRLADKARLKTPAG